MNYEPQWTLEIKLINDNFLKFGYIHSNRWKSYPSQTFGIREKAQYCLLNTQFSWTKSQQSKQWDSFNNLSKQTNSPLTGILMKEMVLPNCEGFLTLSILLTITD